MAERLQFIYFFLIFSGVSAPGWPLALLHAGILGARWTVVLQGSTSDFQGLSTRRKEEQKSGARGFHFSEWYGNLKCLALIQRRHCGSNHRATWRVWESLGPSPRLGGHFTSTTLWDGRRKEPYFLSWQTGSSLYHIFFSQQFVIIFL